MIGFLKITYNLYGLFSLNKKNSLMIYVTGGTGMLGAHLLHRLTKSGYQVRALKRENSNLDQTKKIFSYYSSEEEAKQLLAKIEWVEGDLLDRDSIREHLEGIDFIIHAAAMVSFNRRDRYAMLHNNVEGTANLVDLARESGINRFCHVSSTSALGNPPEGVPSSEEHVWNNSRKRTAYGKSKFLSEMEVWRGMNEGMEVLIVNPGVIIGPGNWDSGSPQFFKTIWNGFKFYTRGGTGFVDVLDVSAAIVSMMDQSQWEVVKNQRYVLVARNVGFREFFNLVADNLGKRRPTIPAGDWLLAIAWRLALIVSWFSSSSPAITHDSVNGSNRMSHYDGAQITRIMPFQYSTVEESVARVAKIFLNEHR
ncbi:NAD-dependent epimerase [Prolixibacter sp. SD074]|nr:NAD-dependent epimerase [Prolixibacter sp. SD074]